MNATSELVLFVVGLHLVALAAAGAIIYWALQQKASEPGNTTDDSGGR